MVNADPAAAGEIAEAIEQLRAQLTAVQEGSQDARLRFAVTEVEISRRSSSGLLLILAVPRRRPSSVIRTRMLRRRCKIHSDDLPAVISCLHKGLPQRGRRMLCTFQHPPGAEARS